MVTRTNLIKNPSFETNTTGWTAMSSTVIARVSSGSPPAGSWCMSATGTGGGAKTATGTSGIPVIPSTPYTFQFKTKAATVGRLMNAAFYWYNSSGVEITNEGFGLSNNSTSAWSTNSVTKTSPSNAAYVAVQLRVIGAAAGEVHYFDAAMLEQASTADTYFDGSSVLTGHTFAWTGTAHASTSTDTYTPPPPNTGSATSGSWDVAAGSVTGVRAPTGAGASGAWVYSGSGATGLHPNAGMADNGNWDYSGGGTGLFTRYSAADDGLWAYTGTAHGGDPAPEGFAADGNWFFMGLGGTGDNPGTSDATSGVWEVSGSASGARSRAGSGSAGVWVYTGSGSGASPIPPPPPRIPVNVGLHSRIEVETSPGSWLNITGPTKNVSIDRVDSDVGTLSAEVLDADLDPTQTDTLHIGLQVRVRRDNNGTWESIYTGKVSNVEVSYHPLGPEDRTVDVKITAVDAVATIANIPEARGVGTITDLRWLMAGTSVPFLINGNSSTTTGTVVATNENASLWDQVLITRDSNLGYAWVDAENRLRVYDAAYMPSEIAAEIGPDLYSTIDNDFNLDQIINTITVNWRRYNIGTETSADVPYGPFTDATSVALWGTRSATFTVQGAVESESDISDFAQTVLGLNSTPSVRAKSVTLPMKYTDSLYLAGVDLNSRVSVTLADGVTEQTLRVIGIKQTLDSRGWFVTYELSPIGALTPPSQTPGTPNAYNPPGTIGEDELGEDVHSTLQDIYDAADAAAQDAQEAADTGTAALTAANGKSKVTYSASGPGVTPNKAGDIWFQRSGNLIYGQWEGMGGTTWAGRTLAGAVIAYLDAGQLTAGSAFTNALAVKTLFTLGDGVTNGVIKSYNFEGSSVGVYIDKNGLVAKGGTIAGATLSGSAITGGTITGVTVEGSTLRTATSGPRVEIGISTGVLDPGGISFFDSAGAYAGKMLGTTTSVTIQGKPGSTSFFVGTDACTTPGDLKGNELYALGVPVASGGQSVFMGSGGRLFAHTAPSHTKYKRDIEDLDVDLDSLADPSLGPIRFRYREDVPFDVDDPDEEMFGIRADVADELGGLDFLLGYGEDGEVHSVREERLIWALLKGFADNRARIIELESRLAALEN